MNKHNNVSTIAFPVHKLLVIPSSIVMILISYEQINQPNGKL